MLTTTVDHSPNNLPQIWSQKLQGREFRILILSITAWMVLVIASMLLDITDASEHTIKMAKITAQAHFDKDQSVRLWATRHGGVYVPRNERTPPNPNLSHIPERDISTPSGKELTLMNPAYIVRQLSEEYPELYGVKGRIVSDQPVNPNNLADSWEMEALENFKQGGKERFEIADYKGVPHLRLFKPMIVQEGCLKCHGFQGYQVGDVRGGVGVAIDMKPYFEIRDELIKKAVMTHISIFLFGVGLLYFTWILRLNWISGFVEQGNLLQEREQDLSRAQEIAGMGSWVYHPHKDELSWSDQLFRIFDLQPGTLPPNFDLLFSKVKAKDQERVRRYFQIIQHKPVEETTITFCIQTDAGETKTLECHVDVRWDQNQLISIRGVMQDISKKIKVEETLRTSEELFRTLTMTAPVGVFLTDAEGCCSFVNQKWCQIAEKSYEESLGNGWTQSIHPQDRSLVETAWNKFAHENQPFALEYRFLNQKGEETWVFGQAAAFYGQDGAVSGYVGTITDITESKIRERKLAIAQSKAESASQAKSQFLSIMSHELRTPLNGVLGLSQVLYEDLQGDEEKQTIVQNILKSGFSLLSIIEDILDFTRLGKRKLKPKAVVFSPWALGDKMISLFSSAASDKGLKLTLEINPSVHDSLVGDPFILEQILSNLIGNAIKFTERGSVTLGVAASPILSNRQTLRISVKDTGIGIKTEDQDKIFDIFSQADGSTTRMYGGIGLGLAITNQLLNEIEGQLHLESEFGLGSTFWFEVTLPIKESKPAQDVSSLPSPTLQPATKLRPIHCLLVEDDLINQTVLSTMLHRGGVNVHIANTGREAVEMAGNAQYDLIFMDWLLPIMDGLEATQRIRELPGYEQTKIVGITAKVLEGDRERCLLAGMDEFIPKPVMWKQIQRILDTL